jgi:hypothetical protein
MALLTKLGFIKSTIDSSLWFRDGLILVFYVDNGIIISLNNVMILHFIEDLREECKLDLGIEADYAGYLGVDLIKLPDGSMLMSQTGLIECILTDLSLKDSASSKITPAADILGPFKASPRFEESFNCWSVLGKILYVSSNTRCEITLANHQCARFSIDPRSPHGVALRQIGRYHLGSRKKGMIIKPTKDLTLDCYADADFAGLFSTSDPDDPKSVSLVQGTSLPRPDSCLLGKQTAIRDGSFHNGSRIYISRSSASRSSASSYHSRRNIQPSSSQT